jgi:heme oxygenase
VILASEQETQLLPLGQPILSLLRQATQAQHQALELALGLDRPGIEREQYVALVRRMHALYTVLEGGTPGHPGLHRHAATLAGLGLDWAQRRKVPLLEKDLKQLGALPLQRAHYPAGRVDLTNLPQALGCMYVLEGATLGGQYITRNVGRHLHLTPDRGLAFFSSYRREVGPMWRAFRACLQAEVNTPHIKRQCVASAVDTFDLFHQWLAL